MTATQSHFARPTILARGRCARRAGFTLLEVILALALTIMLLSGVYEFYASTLKSREAGYASMREILLMRSLLAGIAEEIRHTTDMVPGDGNGFKGTHDNITIVRLRMPERYAYNEYDEMTDDLPPAQMDIDRVGYQLLWDEELVDDENVPVCHGLWRTLQKTFDPNPSFVIEDEDLAGLEGESEEESAARAAPRIEGELVAPEIKYLRFEYFDGAQWRDRWQVAYEGAQTESGETEGTDEAGAIGQAVGGQDKESGGYVLPQAVRITIGRERVPPEEEEFDITVLEETEEEREDEVYHADRYTVVVYLRQADQSLLSSRKHGVDNDLSLGATTEGF